MLNELNEPKPFWGGAWTEKKLDAFEKYVNAYLTIMDKNPYWKTIYFDAFAGSGDRDVQNEEIFKQLSILPEQEFVYKGAAERVVSMKKKFDWYYFIDSDKKSVSSLKNKLELIFPERKKSFVFRVSDSNDELIKLSKALKEKKLASLIFLDPFGMQIKWDAIKALKNTKSDIWILIPTGVIVNRLLDKKGELKHIKKLESFFGMREEEIRKFFYKSQKRLNLFGQEDEMLAKVMSPIQKIADLYIKNLSQIWKHTIETPLVLENNNGTPIFHFVFASNNKTAVEIAQQIIKSV